MNVNIVCIQLAQRVLLKISQTRVLFICPCGTTLPHCLRRHAKRKITTKGYSLWIKEKSSTQFGGRPYNQMLRAPISPEKFFFPGQPLEFELYDVFTPIQFFRGGCPLLSYGRSRPIVLSHPISGCYIFAECLTRTPDLKVILSTKYVGSVKRKKKRWQYYGKQYISGKKDSSKKAPKARMF